MQAEPTNNKRRTTAAPQPLSVITVDDAQLRIATVCALTGLGRATIYRKVKEGTFPEPQRHGLRCTRWRALGVRQWLGSQTTGGA
jgi:prophage regulatory protein